MAPDVFVKNTTEDELIGFDRELKTAVDEALKMLREGQFEGARSKLREMKTLLQGVSGEVKENLAENIALLQTEIHLAEGAIEVALFYLEQNDPDLGDRIIFLFTGLSLYTVIDSNWTQFREGLARTYEKKGDLDQAIAEYERLISPDPKKTGSLIHPRFYYSLGKLYEAKGRKDKAHIQYRRFLDLWKDADRASPKSKMPKPAWLP